MTFEGEVVFNIGLVKWIVILAFWFCLIYRGINAKKCRDNDKLLWVQLILNIAVIVLILVEGVSW